MSVLPAREQDPGLSPRRSNPRPPLFGRLYPRTFAQICTRIRIRWPKMAYFVPEWPIYALKNREKSKQIAKKFSGTIYASYIDSESPTPKDYYPGPLSSLSSSISPAEGISRAPVEFFCFSCAQSSQMLALTSTLRDSSVVSSFCTAEPTVALVYSVPS